MSNPLPPLAQVVTDALADKKISQNAAATLSGIPRETLRRLLVTGDFRYRTHLWPIATVLDTTPADLMAQAEERAA